MNMSEQFQRFASDCEVMAKFTSNPENQLVWRRMAERWVQCAELYNPWLTLLGQRSIIGNPHTTTGLIRGQPNRGMFSADRRARSACRRGKPVLRSRHGRYDLSRRCGFVGAAIACAMSTPTFNRTIGLQRVRASPVSETQTIPRFWHGNRLRFD